MMEPAMAKVKVDASNPLKLTVVGDPRVLVGEEHEPIIGLALETLHAGTEIPLPIELVLEKDGAALLLELLKAAQERGILPRSRGKARSNWRH
jgi:hypothetical protein